MRLDWQEVRCGPANTTAASAYPIQIPGRVDHLLDLLSMFPAVGQGVGSCVPTLFLPEHRYESLAETGLDIANEAIEPIRLCAMKWGVGSC